MTVKEFAAAVGISQARARSLAPTIPGAEKDPDRTVAGKHPWNIPDSAVSWFNAEEHQEPKEEPARPFPQPPATATPEPGGSGTLPLMKYWPALALLALLALLTMKATPKPPRNQSTARTWPI